MNRNPYQLVILIVGLVLLVAVVAISYLATIGQAIPDVLQNVAVGALTGLVGLLVPSQRNPRANL